MNGVVATTRLLARLQPEATPIEDPLWLVFARDAWAMVYPYRYFVLVLLAFWFLARRSRREKEDFNAQAQRVLDEKYKKGEISKKAYDKYRQDIALRPRR